MSSLDGCRLALFIQAGKLLAPLAQRPPGVTTLGLVDRVIHRTTEIPDRDDRVPLLRRAARETNSRSWSLVRSCLSGGPSPRNESRGMPGLRGISDTKRRSDGANTS